MVARRPGPPLPCRLHDSGFRIPRSTSISIGTGVLLHRQYAKMQPRAIMPALPHRCPRARGRRRQSVRGFRFRFRFQGPQREGASADAFEPGGSMQNGHSCSCSRRARWRWLVASRHGNSSSRLRCSLLSPPPREKAPDASAPGPIQERSSAHADLNSSTDLASWIGHRDLFAPSRSSAAAIQGDCAAAGARWIAPELGALPARLGEVRGQVLDEQARA